MATKKKTSRKKKAAEPRGLDSGALMADTPPAELLELLSFVEADGGAPLASYRDPLGGHWQALVALPIEKVEPTPFQRDLSDTHVKKLQAVIDRLDRFLDPIIVVRSESGQYWTPNGHHRWAALKRSGGKTITALLLPDRDVMLQILALNTEKSPNLKDRALEVVRMARMLADLDAKEKESTYSVQFEEPSYLTLGVCYEKKKSFSGSSYQPVVKRVDSFLDQSLDKALAERERRAEKVWDLDAAVAEVVKGLKEQGLDSPYLKTFVVARINPLRFKRGAKAEFDETLDKMIDAAKKFDVSKVTKDQIGGGGGGGVESDE